MYFKEKEDTNIDKEFAKEKKLELNFNPKMLLFIGGGIVLLLIVIFILISLMSSAETEEQYTIELIGGENITINLGEEYKEPGYRATDEDGNDVSDEVNVTNTIDNSKPGTYEVLYMIESTDKIRYVTVTNNVINNVEATYIYLLGKKDMYLEVGEEYKEPGYQVYDSKEQGLTEKVTVTGTVDTTKVGSYQLTYTVVNSRNITTSVTRRVIVVSKGTKIPD